MKKVLITGFEPFGGEKINPSWEAVCQLDDRIGEYSVAKLRLPVVFGEAAKIAIEAAEEIKPDAILCIGQAGGRAKITPELLGINLRFAKIPDNGGNLPIDERIEKEGEAAYFSTLPVRKISEAINSAGIDAELSYTAGSYVCNDLLYSLLSHFKGSETRIAFIHVPYVEEQGKEPFTSLSNIVKALKIAVENLDD